MKATLERGRKYYDITLTPETVQEALAIVDFGMNRVKELRYVETTLDEMSGYYSSRTPDREAHAIRLSIVLGRRSRINSRVKGN